jgi:hypothetical protein
MKRIAHSGDVSLAIETRRAGATDRTPPLERAGQSYRERDVQWPVIMATGCHYHLTETLIELSDL